MKPISEISPQECRRLVAVFSDIDDTLTIGGRIPIELLETVRRVRASGLKFVAVTGRPAGFGITLTTYFDQFDATICENGA